MKDSVTAGFESTVETLSGLGLFEAVAVIGTGVVVGDLLDQAEKGGDAEYWLCWPCWLAGVPKKTGETSAQRSFLVSSQTAARIASLSRSTGS